MRTLLVLSCFVLIASPGAGAFQALTDQHVDLAINFRPPTAGSTTNPWRLTVRDEETRKEFGGQRAGAGDPLEVVLRASLSARFEVPDDPSYAFLGAAGAPVWVLTQTQEPGILFLGTSTENKSNLGWTGFNVDPSLLALGVSPGVFLGNAVTLRLASFSGPGNFFVWVDDLGVPQPRVFDTSNGLSAADSRTLTPGNHTHFNWAFTAPGIYDIGFQASGTLAAGSQFTQSEVTTFRFEVIPEPGGVSLGLAGLVLLGALRPGRPIRAAGAAL